MNMPIAIVNHFPLLCSLSESRVTSSLTSTKRSYSVFSRVNSFMSSEPDTLSVSVSIWFILSRSPCASASNFQRVCPTLRVGNTNSGITATPTIAIFQFIANSAISVATTVVMLLIDVVSVFEITLPTPLISLSIRVRISPCFSVV
ncbi:hypothetical protein SDC9_130709 [bioreactor metagenome]|uniref:Uncharacterized protein n=1 Tax=bioreactor metagenome TaxID=1076179 RepID=A0A645D2E6_9ZZZZ